MKRRFVNTYTSLNIDLSVVKLQLLRRYVISETIEREGLGGNRGSQNVTLYLCGGHIAVLRHDGIFPFNGVLRAWVVCMKGGHLTVAQTLDALESHHNFLRLVAGVHNLEDVTLGCGIVGGRGAEAVLSGHGLLVIIILHIEGNRQQYH